MIVVVTGGRDLHNREYVFETLDRVHTMVKPITLLVEGGAPGADQLANYWAEMRGIKTVTVPADWDAHKKAAGPIRNARMLDTYKPECVIAFPGGRGTANCVKLAKERGIPVGEVSPWRLHEQT